jgi:nucleolar protein 4
MISDNCMLSIAHTSPVLTLPFSFKTFGPLRYARITLEPATGRGRGTAFACFWNKEDADQALAFSDALKADTGLGAPAAKKNPFKLPSLLTPDPSSTAAQTLVLGGRTLDLARAVTRDKAGKLREQGERAREKQDKRNLYLLREGGTCSLCSKCCTAHADAAQLQ